MRDAELTPEQEEQVRRLLADARHTEPIPVDVADRLDHVLADLPRDEPADGLAPVVDLTARRRRRHAAALLAGAAAVIVGGFAVGQVIDVGNGGRAGDAGGSADQPVDRASGGDQAESLAGSEVPGTAGADRPPSAQAGAPMKLSSTHLQRDLSAQLPSAEADQGYRASAPRAGQSFGCKTAAASAYGTGRFFAAYFDGIPAVVALRPAAGDTQRADVLDCATAAELGSALIASR